MDEIELSEVTCPFCESKGECPHLLLVVDRTFQAAEGGSLMEAFDERLSAWISKHEDAEHSDEGDGFDDLVDEVSSLADADIYAVTDSAPGMSSTYSVYYASSEENANLALQALKSKLPS